MEVVCGTHHFLVHESILSAQSEFFSNALNTDMKVGYFTVDPPEPCLGSSFVFFLDF